jgi:hypothetical protein
VAKIKYLGMPLTNGSDIHKAINDSLNFRNPFYHSFRISCLPFTKLAQRLIWVQNMVLGYLRVLRRISGCKTKEVVGELRNCIIRNFEFCFLHKLLLG